MDITSSGQCLVTYGCSLDRCVIKHIKKALEAVSENQVGDPYEVDFLIQRGNDIFPVEVKADTNFGGKSHRKFKELFADQVKLRGGSHWKI